MDLTREEENLLSGVKGPGVQKAMEILVAIGDIVDAERLIPVKSVQISGVSYKTIGDAGLEFLKELASFNTKTSVLSTLNPAGIDLEMENPDVPLKFLRKQKEILNTYEKLGANLSCTCTPYLSGNIPSRGEHIAWAESSAVAYANSVLGSRTNRESSITALASAITGKTPYYGLHLDENRLPTFMVEVKEPLKDSSDFSLLGYYVGKHFDGIPLFKGIKPDLEGFKAISAGLATGKISMFHVQDMTPNILEKNHVLEKISFSGDEIEDVKGELNTCEEPDIVCVGCPHCTLKEIDQVVKSDTKKDVWVYTARGNKNLFRDRIKNKNIRVISDTCMVVQPLEEMGVESLGTNSAKCAYYSKNLSGLDVRYDSLLNLLKD